MNKDQFREALGQFVGQVMTPALCAELEVALFGAPDRRHAPAKFGRRVCGGLVFAVERFEDVLEPLHQLHLAHWQETERHRHGLAMDPDYDAMRLAEWAGEMLQFTARAGGELVGNCRMYIRTSLHTQTQFAVEDTLYLAPAHRGGRRALRFVEFVHDSLRLIGVREVRCTAKLVNGTAEFFQKALGYQPVATELVKFLED